MNDLNSTLQNGVNEFAVLCNNTDNYRARIQALNLKYRRYFSEIKCSYNRKLRSLETEKNSVSVWHNRGSTRIASKTYSINPQKLPYTKKIRPARRIKRRQNKLKRMRPAFGSGSQDEDPRAIFDPIVLTDKVQLSKEQIEVCRLPDCFAPTPKEPIDVVDQVIGTNR